ncbi:Guanylate kinase-like protein [Hapsidospora chrysogenum ATCC 11550]|uniref:Guanylate kinase n=1 Tax=Hapsidospora chrysogenum (strain ATCC 11550 / CBS 779.69 / DSM 880 / IAM 14645 / JCM 23072 / IMI 49137) TaxID=857340 RepID=A0A086T205_HAPC1|nr:Guanylate kinase-like protein [Hapsidospora chrysogenum ATCC 11550]
MLNRPTYNRPPRKRTAPPDPRPIVISGPSGVGKGTLYTRLRENHPGCFAFSVSHTSRKPRAGEQHGVDYHYVSMEEFEDLIAKDSFIEHAKFGDNRYGTSKMTIEEQSKKGQVVLLDIEMEGVKQMKKSGIKARYIFIAPPSLEALEARLRGRGTENEESIQKRLAQAKNELEYSKTPGVHDIIILNDDLDTAYKQLEEFVYKAPEDQ